MTKWSEENKDKAKKLLSEGRSLRDMSKELGISKSAIHSFFNKNKLVSEPPRPEENTIENNITIEYKDTMDIDELTANQFMGEILGTKDKVERPAPTAKQMKQVAKADDFLNSLLEPEVEAPAKPTKTPRGRKAKVPENQFIQVHQEDTTASMKGDLIAKITMNVNNFEPLLKDFVKPTKEAFLTGLYKKSLSELESLLKTLETTRSVSNMSNQFLHFFWLGSNMVEVGSPHIGLDTTGLTNALKQQQDEIQMIMKEICMDRVDTFKKIQKPEYRLAMILTTTAIGISTQNQMRKLQPQLQQQVMEKRTSLPPAVAQPKEKIEVKTPVLHKTLIPEDTKVQFNDL